MYLISAENYSTSEVLCYYYNSDLFSSHNGFTEAMYFFPSGNAPNGRKSMPKQVKTTSVLRDAK
jgi:hypothetical protein